MIRETVISGVLGAVLTTILGCAPITPITIDPAEYRHLYTATEQEGVSRSRITADLSSGKFVAGVITHLGEPGVEYNYSTETANWCYRRCKLRVYTQSGKSPSADLIETTITFFFSGTAPTEYDIHRGNLIIVKITSLSSPHRLIKERSSYGGVFVRNLTRDWNEYKLPPTTLD